MKLPSLAALRAFEAAARLGSFQMAADALRLTPSAVSHQIRMLEIGTGQALFRRGRRGVSLTDAGLRLQGFVSRGFAELASGLASLSRDDQAKVVRITAPPSFAARFLTHHIEAFEAAHPPFELRLEVSNLVADLNSDGLDVAVRCVEKPPAELFSEKVLPIVAGPVCSPARAEGLSEPGQLAGLARITSPQDRGGWKAWLRVAGQDALNGSREIRYETLDAAVQASLDGHGVAIVPLSLVSAHIDAGRLVSPFTQTIHSKLSYWLVCRRGEEDFAKIAGFRRWLKRELKTAQPV